MKDKTINQNKPWVAIIWFTIWGLFQSYAVVSVITGNWSRPEAFPQEAYNALIYPDIFFIPLYLITSVLLFRYHHLGKVFGLIAGGAIIYVMIYLLALSGFSGAINLSFDSIFLVVNIFALLQIAKLNNMNERQR